MNYKIIKLLFNPRKAISKEEFLLDNNSKPFVFGIEKHD
ncbi:hypothetical protein C8N26_2086 [Tenacibaculum lutimaris]|uniref:Uncharacterized protein n=1 Tax=Tenacibaculum lutimaris TaxID=285258 RepID=A0A420E0T1_9FLAO|nr:hypothetical protein C8N26_2086 [Tenacibaculum lutimaris]